jgi:hypothetical protein
VALEAIGDLLEAGAWEPLWQWRLASRGLPMVQEGSIVVYHSKQYTLGGFVTERYRYARSLASQRAAGQSWPWRAARAAATPLVPAVLLLRLWRQVLPKARHRRELLLSLPYLIVFASVCALGEAVGYAAGPGRSAERIA